LSRAVAFWPVQGDASGAVWNGVQLRATLWDGFVGSNVGFFAPPLPVPDPISWPSYEPGQGQPSLLNGPQGSWASYDRVLRQWLETAAPRSGATDPATSIVEDALVRGDVAGVITS